MLRNFPNPPAWTSPTRRARFADAAEWDDEYDADTDDERGQSEYVFFDDEDDGDGPAVGDDDTVARDDISLRGTQGGGGEVGAADADSAGGLVRKRSGRQRRPTLFFHDDRHARADDAECRVALGDRGVNDGRRAAHRGGRGCGGSQ